MPEWETLTEIIGVILQLIFLEGILSLDNAAVLGAMVAHLPKDEGIPWPAPLRPLGRLVEPVLGPQQAAALKVGLLGAYLGRGTMLLLASMIIRNPWLQLLGALYLIYIATEHLGTLPDPGGDPAESADQPRYTGSRRGFWPTVLQVELADLAFSLDNVVVAVTLSRNLLLVMTGVALGILTMRFAASLFARLVEREPVLATGAYILVLNIGLEFLLHEFAGIEIAQSTRFGINAGTLLMALVYGRSPALQRVLSLPLQGCRWLVFYLHRLVSLILWPLGWLVRSAFQAVTAVLNTLTGRADP